MNTKNILTALLLSSCFFYGCKKKDIPLYEGGNYVQFTAGLQDTLNMSFFFYPNKDVVDLPVPLRLVGKMSAEAIPFKIVADGAGSTALPNHYSLPESFFFKAGRPLDTAYIRINKTPEMANKEFVLVLKLEATENSMPGQTGYTRRVLKISDMVRKPLWWTTTIDTYSLGIYSEAKYRKFMEVTGIGDLSVYSTFEQRDYMLQFKYYLIKMRDAGTPVLEADGSDMLSTVPLIG